MTYFWSGVAVAVIVVLVVALVGGSDTIDSLWDDKGVCFDPPTYHGTVQGTGVYTTNPKDC